LGLWPEIVPQAEPIREIRVSDGDAPFFLHYDHRELEGRLADAPLGYMVENDDIKRALLRHVETLPGVALIAGATLRELACEAEGVTARLNDGRRIAARAPDGDCASHGHAAIAWKAEASALPSSVFSTPYQLRHLPSAEEPGERETSARMDTGNRGTSPPEARTQAGTILRI